MQLVAYAYIELIFDAYQLLLEFTVSLWHWNCKKFVFSQATLKISIGPSAEHGRPADNAPERLLCC